MPAPRHRKGQRGKEAASGVKAERTWREKNAEGIITVEGLQWGAAALAFALYTNAIAFCGFCYDDLSAIVDNPDVLDRQGDGEMSSFAEVWKNDFWGTSIAHRLSHKSYRPVVVLSFRSDAVLSSGEPWMFHLTNAVLYAVCAWLFVHVMLRPWHSGATATEPAVLAMLWFTTHPIHTEAVTSLVGRAEVMAAICGMLATKLCFSSKRVGTGVVVLLLGCLCKETALMFPAIMLGVDLSTAVLAPAETRTPPSSPSRLLRSAAMVTLIVGYLALRVWLTGGTQTVATSFQDNFMQHLGPMDKLRTAIYIQATYIWLLLCPRSLSCDYSFAVIRPVRAWAAPEMAFAAVIISGVLAWARYGILTLRRSGVVTPLLALGWTLGPLVPASHIVPIGTVLAERLLFIPSIGMAILVAHIAACAASRSRLHGGVVRIVVVACTCWFALSTVRRNPDWADIDTLHTRDFETHPDSIKLLLAAADRNKDRDFGYAFECASRAQALVDAEPPGPGSRAPPFNAGLTMMASLKTKTDGWSEANATEAVQLATRVVNEIGYNNSGGNAGWSSIHKVLGIAYLKLATPTGDKPLLEKAETAFSTAILYDVNAEDPESHCRLGMVLGMLGRPAHGHASFATCFQMDEAAGKASQASDLQNYAVLMLDLAGLAAQDVAAAKRWGSQAAAAVQTVIDMLPRDAPVAHREEWAKTLAALFALRDTAQVPDPA